MCRRLEVLPSRLDPPQTLISRQQTASRLAFTLLELLLTLAVLAAITAVSIPHVGSLLGDRRLVRAGDQVQIEMNRLRVDAMRQGRVMMIEALTGGNSIRVKPFHSVTDATEAIDQTGSQSGLLAGATQGSIAAPATNQPERLIELPAEVTIASVGVVSAARAAEIEQASLADQSAGWSRPVLFYPDGSTSTAAIVLRHRTMGQLTVKLRGITGQATVSQVMP